MQGKLTIQMGHPLQFSAIDDVQKAPSDVTPVGCAIAKCLGTYVRTARKLLDEKYKVYREFAPIHLRELCSIFVLECRDGVLVRYDAVLPDEAKVRVANTKSDLTEMAPIFSEKVVLFPRQESERKPPLDGPSFAFMKTDQSGAQEEISRFQPVVFGTTSPPDGFILQPPPARPTPLLSIQNEFELSLEGVVVPVNKHPKAVEGDLEQFILHGRSRLGVGWQAIEVYAPMSLDHWKTEYASFWADYDILAAVAQRNILTSSLRAIDGRGDARKKATALLLEMDSLLQGPEEPLHQFIKQHPEILCPTCDCFWSKLPFGSRVSDFVFREPANDYLLVEIEAPTRELFRQDGQQREPLTHAINQISDWLGYISTNRAKVESDLGLAGISTNPRTLVVIGRSESLTDDNRSKLTTIQSQNPKLRILTYDDVLEAARSTFEKLLGPLGLVTGGAELYFYKMNR